MNTDKRRETISEMNHQSYRGNFHETHREHIAEGVGRVGGERDTPMYVLLLLLALLVSTLTGLFLVLCVTLKIELRDSVNETETVTKNLNRERGGKENKGREGRKKLKAANNFVMFS